MRIITMNYQYRKVESNDIRNSRKPERKWCYCVSSKKILAECEGETKYVSLAGKKINACISCLRCAKDNKCVVEDDFQSIAEEMVKAEAIVIGVPNYYNVPNGLSHCLLERCFCFRHQSVP